MIVRRFAAVFAVALLTACVERMPVETSPQSAQALEGTYWRLAELEGRPAVAGISGREAYIRLTANGERMGGSTGCNSISGTYRAEGDRLRFPQPISSTRMACPAVMEQERKLIEALAAAERFEIAGGRLVLYGGGRRLARFEAGTPR
jgi:heat shock protein HslJ